MRPTHIFSNLRVPDIDEAKEFYAEFLGLTHEEFNMGWVARFTSSDSRLSVQLLTRDATAREDAVISVATDDIDLAYEEAVHRGYEIVHDLTAEEWGLRRFLVRAPDGNIVNIVDHRSDAHDPHD